MQNFGNSNGEGLKFFVKPQAEKNEQIMHKQFWMSRQKLNSKLHIKPKYPKI